MEDAVIRDYISFLFDGYLKRKHAGTLYSVDSIVPQKIIEAYYQSVKNPQFKAIYGNFKQKYLYNESRIDVTLSKHEREGLAAAYDYVENYDFESKDFNIFVEALRIHQLLFSKCPGSDFGGTLRQDDVYLLNTDIQVPPASEARAYFQSYGDKNNIERQLPVVDTENMITIFNYINACIYVTTELIRYQPFPDGNKRTFRTLLNLMFKKYNLPPVYIKVNERKEYKDALIKAMSGRKYLDLSQFYYYKICDSIYDLDVLPDIEAAKAAKKNEKLALTLKPSDKKQTDDNK